jgi:hypothetical protein
MTALQEWHRSSLKLAPEPFAADLCGWVEAGLLPDDELLIAILANDLHKTTVYAGNSLTQVRATLHWLVNFAPPTCFGSKDRQHMDQRGRPRRIHAPARREGRPRTSQSESSGGTTVTPSTARPSEEV